MKIRCQPEDFRVEERLDRGVVPSTSVSWTPASAYAVFRVEKRSMTTPDAAGALARRLGVRAADVRWCGLKDRHAVAVQHLSVHIRTPASASALPQRVESGTAEGRWSAHLIGFVGCEASAAMIAGNRFFLVLRGMTRAEAETLQTSARRWCVGVVAGDAACGEAGDREVHGTLRLVNLFGRQRFVSAAHGRGFAGRELIEGRFDHAVRLLIATPVRGATGGRGHLLRVCAAAWPCETLRDGRGDDPRLAWDGWLKAVPGLPNVPERRAAEVIAHAVAAGEIAVGRGVRASAESRAGAGGLEMRVFREAFMALPHLTRQMAVEAYQSWLWNRAAKMLAATACAGAGDDADLSGERALTAGLSRLIGVAMPMPWPGLAVARGGLSDEAVWRGAMDRVLEAEGLRPERLVIPGVRRPAFREAWRNVVVEATSFRLGPVERDELAARGGTSVWARTLEFELPRGAYATTVLEGLVSATAVAGVPDVPDAHDLPGIVDASNTDGGVGGDQDDAFGTGAQEGGRLDLGSR
jgi:tRNA(Glu) U13 pseudouridine synthase TruD